MGYAMRAILFMYIAFCLVACGTRNMRTEERKDIRREEAGQVLEGSVMGITISDNMAEKLRRERAYTVTILSSPDSAGRQWPLSVEEGMVTEDYTADHLILKDSTGIQSKNEQRNTLETDKSNIVEKTNVDMRPVPTIVWWFLVVGGLIAALLSWFVKKRK